MDGKWHNVFRSEEDISPDMLLQYVKGELSPAQRHRVEKHLLDYPYLADTVEGLEMLLKEGEDPAAILITLEGMMGGAAPEPKPQTNWRTIGVAASVVLLLGIGGWYFTGQQFAPDNQLAEKAAPEEVENAELITDSVELAETPTEDSEETVAATEEAPVEAVPEEPRKAEELEEVANEDLAFAEDVELDVQDESEKKPVSFKWDSNGSDDREDNEAGDLAYSDDVSTVAKPEPQDSDPTTTSPASPGTPAVTMERQASSPVPSAPTTGEMPASTQNVSKNQEDRISGVRKMEAKDAPVVPSEDDALAQNKDLRERGETDKIVTDSVAYQFGEADLAVAEEGNAKADRDELAKEEEAVLLEEVTVAAEKQQRVQTQTMQAIEVVATKGSRKYKAPVSDRSKAEEFYRKEKYKKALPLFESERAKYPTDADLKIKTAVCRWKTDQPEAALPLLQEAAVSPNMALKEEALWNQAQILLELVRIEEAKKALQQVVDMGMVHQNEARELLKVL